MREQEYIDKFDRVLRYYVRPFLVKLIHKISEAHLPEFDLVNEYCLDNKLEFIGAKPKRKESDQVILKNLILGEDWPNEKIQAIARTAETSLARDKIVIEITRGMDVQAAMRLFVYRWFDVKTVGYPNIQAVSNAIGIDPKRLNSIRTSLDMLIFARNKGGAHYTDNSDISKKEYDRKMQHVGIIFRELSFLDEELFAEYEELYNTKETPEVAVEVEPQQEKKSKKKIIIVAIIAIFVLLVSVGIIVLHNMNTLVNDSNFISGNEWIVETNGEIQIYPNEIYCQENQLVVELWVGNGTDESIKSVKISYELKNSAGKTIVKVSDYKYKFSEELESGEDTLVKMRFDANQVQSKKSDLSTIIWCYNKDVTELKSGKKVEKIDEDQDDGMDEIDDVQVEIEDEEAKKPSGYEGTSKYQGLELIATATDASRVSIKFVNESDRGYSIGWVQGGTVTLQTTEGEFYYTIGNSLKVPAGGSCTETCYFDNATGDLISVSVNSVRKLSESGLPEDVSSSGVTITVEFK